MEEPLQNLEEQSLLKMTAAFQGVLDDLLEKFRKNELKEDDFKFDARNLINYETNNLDSNAKTEFESQTNEGFEDFDLEEIVPVDYELDFEDGEIKVKSGGQKLSNQRMDDKIISEKNGSVQTGKSREDKEIKSQIKLLMTTFEEEKKKLDKKVEVEREHTRKQVELKYEKKLKEEKDFLGTVIADLVKSLEDVREQMEETQKICAEEREKYEEYYKKRLSEEKKKMQQEFQKKLVHAHKQWEKTTL